MRSNPKAALRYQLISLAAATCLGLAIFQKSSAQSNDTVIHLSFNQKDLRITSTPFNRIEVLDNRFDTSKVYTFQDGNYPPKTLNFEGSAPDVIRDYLEKVTSNLSRGNGTLLINIEQLCVPNRDNKLIYGKSKIGWMTAFPLRQCLLFSATAYVSARPGYYIKILEIDRAYALKGPIGSIHGITSKMLNELLEAVSLDSSSYNTLLKKKGYLRFIPVKGSGIKYSHDINEIAFERINARVEEKWEKYPIMSSRKPQPGIYMDFEDFRNAKLTSSSVRLVYDNVDSIFRIPAEATPPNKRFPWAISDSVDSYIRIYKYGNGYVKLNKQNNIFRFYIPQTLPDMYTILSIEELDRPSSSSLNSPPSGNIGIDLVGLIAGVALKESFIAAEKRKLMAKKQGDQYRNCIIDMASGDIIY